MTGYERLELFREVDRLRADSARHYRNHLEAERRHAAFKRVLMEELGLEFDPDDDRALEAAQRRIMELTVKVGAK